MEMTATFEVAGGNNAGRPLWSIFEGRTNSSAERGKVPQSHMLQSSAHSFCDSSGFLKAPGPIITEAHSISASRCSFLCGRPSPGAKQLNELNHSAGEVNPDSSDRGRSHPTSSPGLGMSASLVSESVKGVWRQERFRDSVVAIGAREFRGGQGVMHCMTAQIPPIWVGAWTLTAQYLSERQQ
jgi:hypothetical protein